MKLAKFAVGDGVEMVSFDSARRVPRKKDLRGRIPGRGDSPKVGEFRGAENSPKVGTVGSLLPMTGRKSGYQKKIIPLQTQTIIMKPIFIVYCFAIAIFTSAEVYSQHNHGTKDTTKANKPFDITGVFSTFMSDPELAKKTRLALAERAERTADRLESLAAALEAEAVTA